MALKQFMNSPRGQFALPLINAFNVAAICALGVWHGYLFRAEHPTPVVIELKLAKASTCAPCARALVSNSDSHPQN